MKELAFAHSPFGYNIHVQQPSGRRGGGMVVVNRSNVTKQDSTASGAHSHFECMDCLSDCGRDAACIVNLLHLQTASASVSLSSGGTCSVRDSSQPVDGGSKLPFGL